MLQQLKSRWGRLVGDGRFSEILTGSVWALAARVFATALALVSSIVIARVYGAEMTGAVAVVQSFLSMAAMFTVLGTNNAILRLIPEHLVGYSPSSAFKVYRKTQYLVAGVSLLTGGILFALSDVIAEKVFSKPHWSSFFSLAAFFTVFLALQNLNTQAVRGLRLIRTFAFMQMLPAGSNLIVLLVATFLFFNLSNPVYALLVSFLVTALVGALIMDLEFKKKILATDVISNVPLKDILALSLPMLMSATMTFVIGQTGIIMLGMFRSESEVGYYAIAVKMATLTTFVLSAINSMAAPKFSELFHRGKMDELFYVAQKSAKLIFWTTVPILIVLLMFGRTILKVFFGSEFIASYGAMVLLVLGQFVNSISGSTGYFMNMTNNHLAYRNIILLTSVIAILLNFILIPHFGIFGSAISGMITISFLNISTLFYIYTKYKNFLAYIPFLS